MHHQPPAREEFGYPAGISVYPVGGFRDSAPPPTPPPQGGGQIERWWIIVGWVQRQTNPGLLSFSRASPPRFGPTPNPSPPGRGAHRALSDYCGLGMQKQPQPGLLLFSRASPPRVGPTPNPSPPGRGAHRALLDYCGLGAKADQSGVFTVFEGWPLASAPPPTPPPQGGGLHRTLVVDFKSESQSIPTRSFP